MGWQLRITELPISQTPPSSQRAYTGRTETDSGYAPQESHFGHGGAVTPLKATGLHPAAGKLIPGHAQAGDVSSAQAPESVQAKSL